MTSPAEQRQTLLEAIEAYGTARATGNKLLIQFAGQHTQQLVNTSIPDVVKPTLADVAPASCPTCSPVFDPLRP